MTDAKTETNPLLSRWSGAFGLAPFHKIEPAHYKSAFAAGFAEHKAEVKAIAANPAKPTFTNTIVALEKAGFALNRVGDVFFNLAHADSNPKLMAIERAIAPKLAAHWSAFYLDAKLWKRISALYDARDGLGLEDEDARLLERYHTWFRRAGAMLKAADKKRVKAINNRLAELTTSFSQNVLMDEQAWRLVLDGEADLAGLSDGQRASAGRAASDAGLPGKHLITLQRSSVEGFLITSTRRDLRETAWRAWVQRGEMRAETDNRPILAEIASLRLELANIMGAQTFAEYALHDTMAKTPANVRGLLDRVWPAALARANAERDILVARAASEGQNDPVAAWDWRYLAEKERAARFSVDEQEVRQFLVLERMIEAAFDVAKRLFGLSFEERADLKLYHPDVRAWDVTDADGNHVALFLGDYFARPSKRSGAWMSSYRNQQRVKGDIRPIVVNVMSFARGAEGQPTLLSFDDARTLFHEFGHGLHGMLSDVTYPSLSGTSVTRDFVELPSQLYEHWLSQPEVLKRHARHWKTGKPMPEELLAKLKAARNWNMGFHTVEYTAAAIADMDLHEVRDAATLDVAKLEQKTLKRIGMPKEISLRHRLPHFTHITGGYAAGYYSYMWSEVMDADAFAAFEETGNIFSRKVAKRLKEHIYAAGNRRDPEDAYVAFRGRKPEVEGLLKKRGFIS
ncbi:MAG: M3 family metallopeptidase [Hyphomicrobium aestuarii]|nr:M3 family metallopeptidase [Hyphomicrobium aestuarii]